MPRSKLRFLAFLLSSLVLVTPHKLTAGEFQPRDSPPKGEVKKYTFDHSKIFPGTVRDYWIYVPKQFDPAKPCLDVNQDGLQYKAPEVFDALIHKNEMPVTIGVFVMHGSVKAPSDQALDRFNRSLEYDGLGPDYVRFLLEELLPDVESKTTNDGRAIKLSKNGNDHAIGGSSSGTICAFTAARERPDAFQRVFSAIGTYVGLRGGDDYPTLIRKFEPKPIRVFLQDGSDDLNIYGGDWWMADQEIERVLVFAGYQVKHDWGSGGHNGQHTTRIFPDAMRWLWKDWPSPVNAGLGSPQLKEILSYQVQPDGSLKHKQRYYHLHVPDTADDSGADGIRVDRDGRLYVATRMGIQVCDQAGRVNCIIPTPNGKVANLCFGGPDFETLFATCGDRVYKRKVKVKGACAFEAPIKPAPPRL
jgi:SMP-30/Gluconolactonase/LRE-like region/Putative esterase